MAYSSWLLFSTALLTYGALLVILARRRTGSSLEFWFALVLALAFVNTLPLFLLQSNWSGSPLALLAFSSQVALAVVFYPVARAFLQVPVRRYVLAASLATLVAGLALGLSPIALDTPFGTLTGALLAESVGLVLLVLTWVLAARDTLSRFRRYASPLHRNRISYLAIALALQILSSWIVIQSSPASSAGAVLLQMAAILSLAYAILRHRLADLYWLLAESVSYAFMALLMTAVFVLCLIISTRLFGETETWRPSLSMTIAIVGLVILYLPVWNLVKRALGVALWQRGYDYQRVVQEYSQGISGAQDMAKLAATGRELLHTTLGAKDGVLLIANADETGYTFAPLPEGVAFHLSSDNSIIQEFLARRASILQYDLDLDRHFRTLDAVTRLALDYFHAEVWVPIFCKEEFAGIWAIGPNRSRKRYTSQDLNLLGTLADQTAVALQNARLEESRRAEEKGKEQMRELFQHYVAPPVVKHLLNDTRHIALGGERQTVTILFADLQGFTSLGEQLPPKELVQVLNGYLARAAQTVLRHEGTLDKFMGDGIMAIFNAPLPQSDHAQRAARAALAIQNDILPYASTLPSRLRLAFRIGIHTGEAVVGNIGAAELMNYTAVGDTVNIAKRLEENARSGMVLISQSTLAEVTNIVKARPYESLTVKGRTQPIMTFEITSCEPSSRN